MSENKENKKDKQKFKISEFDKLVVDIRNNLVTRLDDLMSKLLNSTQEKLFIMSDEADSNEEQTRYFELMNQLEVKISKNTFYPLKNLSPNTKRKK